MTCYYPNPHSNSDWLKIYFIQSEALTRSGCCFITNGQIQQRQCNGCDDGTCRSKDRLDQWQRGKLGTGSCTKSFTHPIPFSNDIPFLLLNHCSMEFLGLFSDIILQGQQWWQHEMLAVSSGCIFISLNFIHTELRRRQQ